MNPSRYRSHRGRTYSIKGNLSRLLFHYLSYITPFFPAAGTIEARSIAVLWPYKGRRSKDPPLLKVAAINFPQYTFFSSSFFSTTPFSPARIETRHQLPALRDSGSFFFQKKTVKQNSSALRFRRYFVLRRKKKALRLHHRWHVITSNLGTPFSLTLKKQN